MVLCNIHPDSHVKFSSELTYEIFVYLFFVKYKN